jgi:two-component system chemotaxis response regulator CheY
MPLVNGPDCLAEILKLNPNVKVIMMSGNDEKEVVTQCTKAGAKAFLAKPFDASAAIHLLRKVLDKA